MAEPTESLLGILSVLRDREQMGRRLREVLELCGPDARLGVLLEPVRREGDLLPLLPVDLHGLLAETSDMLGLLGVHLAVGQEIVSCRDGLLHAGVDGVMCAAPVVSDNIYIYIYIYTP